MSETPDSSSPSIPSYMLEESEEETLAEQSEPSSESEPNERPDGGAKKEKERRSFFGRNKNHDPRLGDVHIDPRVSECSHDPRSMIPYLFLTFSSRLKLTCRRLFQVLQAWTRA